MASDQIMPRDYSEDIRRRAFIEMLTAAALALGFPRNETQWIIPVAQPGDRQYQHLVRHAGFLYTRYTVQCGCMDKANCGHPSPSQVLVLHEESYGAWRKAAHEAIFVTGEPMPPLPETLVLGG